MSVERSRPAQRSTFHLQPQRALTAPYGGFAPLRFAYREKPRMIPEPEQSATRTKETVEDGAPEVLPQTPGVLRRRVLGLAWPVIGENMLETSLDIVNTIMVAALGAVALAGVGSGLQIMFFVLAALAALSVGSSILVAQAV